MSNQVKEFNDYRAKMNEVILGKDNLVIKRLFNLDTQTYSDGALNVKTKEIESIGFSKIKAGDTVHFVVSKKSSGTSKEKNRYDAIRVLVIPQEFSVQ